MSESTGRSNIHTVYADFNNADSQGRVRLNVKGAAVGLAQIPHLVVVETTNEEVAA